MADMSNGEHGYDWVDDDDLSLAETDQLFEALGSEPVHATAFAARTDHGFFRASASAFIGPGFAQSTQTRDPDASISVVQTRAARPVALKHEPASTSHV